MEQHGVLEALLLFSTERLQTPAAKKIIFDKSDARIQKIRANLLEAARSEMDHFNSLPCKLTIIKPKKEEKKIPSEISMKNKFILRVSQGSTCVGSSKSVSESEDEECSVSSDTNSNDIDLDDLIHETVKIEIMDGKSGEVIPDPSVSH